MPDAVPVSSKPAGGDPVSAAKKAAAPAAMNAMSVKMAGVIRPYLDKATPALIAIGNVLAMLEPYVVAMWRFVKASWYRVKTSINPSAVIQSSGLVKSYGRTANLR